MEEVDPLEGCPPWLLALRSGGARAVAVWSVTWKRYERGGSLRRDAGGFIFTSVAGVAHRWEDEECAMHVRDTRPPRVVPRRRPPPRRRRTAAA